MSRRVLLTGLTMLVGATPVPSQLLIRDERIEAISRGRSNALDGPMLRSSILVGLW